MEPDFNQQADTLIHDGDLDGARVFLEAAVRQLPAGWSPCRDEGIDDGQSLLIACWDQDEFFAYAEHLRAARHTGIIEWVLGSYSKAWYQLAVIATEQERFEDALLCVDCGLALEPDHPELWCEKGYLLGQVERHQEALECFRKAASVRAWAPASQLARALRGQGVELVDLDRLDAAEEVLYRSLELEPDSPLAHQELEYIDDLRRQRGEQKERIPWFLHTFVHPPKDPLTIQLLALVDDLPSLPGPQTVGAENYSILRQAFMEHGWEGFEEAFDRIVPRDRADYTDLKRDLLCEPVFSTKVHRRLAEAAFGEKTVEEMFEEIVREKQRKPQ